VCPGSFSCCANATLKLPNSKMLTARGVSDGIIAATIASPATLLVLLGVAPDDLGVEVGVVVDVAILVAIVSATVMAAVVVSGGFYIEV
jgi:hypothetical protein